MATSAELLGALCEHFKFSPYNGKSRHVGKKWCIIVGSDYVQFIQRDCTGTFLTCESVKVRTNFVDLYIGNFCIGQIAIEDLAEGDAC